MNNTKKNIFILIENWISYVILALIVLLLLIEVIGRRFTIGIPGSADYIKHLVLWGAFIAAMITTREKKHLSLSMGVDSIKKPYKNWIKIAINFIAVAVCTVFAVTSVRVVLIGFGDYPVLLFVRFFQIFQPGGNPIEINPPQMVGILPVHLFLLIIPIGFLFITLRFILSTEGNSGAKLITGSGILVGIFLSLHSFFYLIQDISIIVNPDDYSLFDYLDGVIISFDQFYSPFISIIFWPCIVLLILSAFLGNPIFIVLGGIAVICFTRAGLQLGDISQEAYGVLTRYEIPAIPLFTLAGFLLSESKAGERFVRLFRALIGWLPGGLAIVAVIVCAFFTTFTGASGVTILALGGFLSIALIQRNYKKDFSYGLLTSAGSVGLLFPPSLPVILYGVAATISIKDLYIGGILPGVLLVIALCIMGSIHAIQNKIERNQFKKEEIIEPLLKSLPELLLPFVIFIGFFTGFTTLVETGAITVLYVFIIEVFYYKDIKIKELPKVLLKGVPIIGGILIIMAIARGFAYFIIDQQIPNQLANWCTKNIQSPWIFLILLNIGLLITGCFLDIFAAIFVVAPLIIPLGEIYGIHPVHLGIIFLANLQLGYLTPPVGLNLFLSSYRFEQPLTKIYKQVIPFFLALLVSVLLITYVAPFTTAFLEPSRNPGEVWLVQEKKETRTGDRFITEIHADTGSEKLSQYELRFEYDPEKLDLDKEFGFNGVEAGATGFVTFVDIPEQGVLIAKGMDILGKLPNRDLSLLNIHWIAGEKGKASVGIEVLSFLNHEQYDIGRKKGGVFKVNIK